MDIKQMIASFIETVIKVAVLILIVRFVYNAAIQAYDYGYRIFAEEPMTVGEGRTISINVKDGESVRDIGKNLEEKGLIRDANLFFMQELLSAYHGEIKPGIYDLNTSMRSEEMLAVMSAEPAEEESGASNDNVPIGEADTENSENPENAKDSGESENTDGTGDAGASEG